MGIFERVIRLRAVLFLLMGAAAAFGCGAKAGDAAGTSDGAPLTVDSDREGNATDSEASADEAQVAERTGFSVRAVSAAPADGFVTVEIRDRNAPPDLGGAQSLFISEKPLLDAGIVESAEVVPVRSAPRGLFAVYLTLTEEGLARVNEVLAERIGEKIAIVIDDEPVSAPIIQAVLTVPTLEIPVSFDISRLRKAVSALNAPYRPAPWDAAVRACEAGNSERCLFAAKARLSGRTIPYDPAAAVGLFRRACDLGNADGCVELSRLLGGDHQLPSQGDAAVIAPVLRACELGRSDACAAAGAAALDKGDKQAAEALFRKACDGGHAEGCERLIEMVVEETGDLSQVVDLVERACRLGARRSCDALDELKKRAGEQRK